MVLPAYTAVHKISTSHHRFYGLSLSIAYVATRRAFSIHTRRTSRGVFIEIDLEKVDAWIAKGAQPTSAVSHLIDIARGDAPEPVVKERKSKKQLAKDAAAAEAADEAAE